MDPSPLADCDDVLWLIFLRLPLLPLVRCRAVLKQWNSIITDPQFLAEYFGFHFRPPRPQFTGYFLYPTRTGFAHRRKPLKFYGTDVSDKGIIAGFEAASSCFPVTERCFVCSSNGVLLCYTMTNNLRVYNISMMTMPGLRYYVCNPMTKEWRELRGPISEDVAAVGFHCREPSAGDGVLYEYEIVRVILPLDEDGVSIPDYTGVQIYSSRTEMWSWGPMPLEIKWNHQKYISMVIGGVFYWLDDKGHFFLYNPARKCLEEGPVPPDEEVRIRKGQVWVSMDESDNGELVLYVGDKKQFRVWVLADAGDDEMLLVWQMKHNVDFATLPEQCPYAGNTKRFLAQPRAVQMPGNPGKAIVGTAGRQVYLYNFETGEMQIPSEGQASCFGKMYNYFYCPYHVPRWYYSLCEEYVPGYGLF